MKTLIVSLFVWIFAIPCLIAIWLILGFADTSLPNLYSVLMGLAAALAILAMMRVLLWFPHGRNAIAGIPERRE